MFWGIIGLRYQSGYEIWADTAYTGTAITLNWFCAMCWFFLILEGKQNKKTKNKKFDSFHFLLTINSSILFFCLFYSVETFQDFGHVLH